MAQAIRFTVLDVGQGTGNFIETFATTAPTPTTPPVATVLIDLGSEKAKNTAGGPSASWVVTQLKRMAAPAIDCVILSHSDSDHINLLKTVLVAFDPPGTVMPTKPVLTVRSAYYGGSHALYGKRGTNVLATLARYCPSGLTSLPSDASSYTATPPGPFRTVDGVDLFLMAGNVTSSAITGKTWAPDCADAFAINTRSLVVVASWGVQYVATGDATGVTMERCNEVVTPLIKSTFLPRVVMLTMPHHGSEATAFDLTGAGAGRSNSAGVRNVKDFAAKMQPASVTASAERKRTFRHPSAYLIGLFWGSIQSGHFTGEGLPPGVHYYTAYFDASDPYLMRDGLVDKPFPGSHPWWYTVRTAKDIFTNLYFDPAMVPDQTGHRTVELPPSPGPVVPTPSATPYPPLGVAWQYTTPQGQDTTIDYLPNRAALVALQRELEEAVMAQDARAEAPGARTPATSAGTVTPWRVPPVVIRPAADGRAEAVPAPVPGLARLRELA